MSFQFEAFHIIQPSPDSSLQFDESPARTSPYITLQSRILLMINDSSFSQLNSNKMKVLILLLVLASGRGMPLGKNGGSFQRKAEQWSRQDNDLSAKHEGPFASMTFEHFSAEKEAPLTFSHFSDENEAPFAFKRPLAEIEAPLARLFDEKRLHSPVSSTKTSHHSSVCLTKTRLHSPSL